MAAGTDTLEDPGNDAPVNDVVEPRPSRLNQTLAWVGIIAGGLFIVGVVFVSGVYAGMVTDGYHGWHRGSPVGQNGPGGSMQCPMMRQGGAMGPTAGGAMAPNQSSPKAVPAP